MSVRFTAAWLGAIAVILSACSGAPPVPPGEISSTGTVATAANTSRPASRFPESIKTIAFDPLVGGTPEFAMALASAIGEEAVASRVTLVPATSTDAAFRVKGFLSPQSGADGAIINHAWDVFDRSGNRVHRITGSARATSAEDPWQVSSTTVIAQQTIAELSAFLRL